VSRSWCDPRDGIIKIVAFRLDLLMHALEANLSAHDIHGFGPVAKIGLLQVELPNATTR